MNELCSLYEKNIVAWEKIWVGESCWRDDCC